MNDLPTFIDGSCKYTSRLHNCIILIVFDAIQFAVVQTYDTTQNAYRLHNDGYYN